MSNSKFYTQANGGYSVGYHDVVSMEGAYSMAWHNKDGRTILYTLLDAYRIDGEGC